MTTVTQYSDFVSRFTYDQISKKNLDKNIRAELAIYKKELERKGTFSDEGLQSALDKRKEELINEFEEDRIWKLSNSHINYSLLDHKYLDYGNRMGFLMFTKFLFGIQRQVFMLAREHPVTVLSFIALQALLPSGWEPEDPLDSTMFITKSPLTRLYMNPIDHMTGAITPYGLKMIYDVST
jgi:hypothetical protein